jgi:hypothetical protein
MDWEWYYREQRERQETLRHLEDRLDRHLEVQKRLREQRNRAELVVMLGLPPLALAAVLLGYWLVR